MSEILNVDGIKVHIEGQGNETILMIHGWPDNCKIWDEQVKVLKENYRCVRFSLPGFETTHEKKAWNLDELNSLFKKIIEEANSGEPVILLIHDWGSLYGYHFYNQFPTLVSKIISVDIGDWKSWQNHSSRYNRFLAFLYQFTLAVAWKINGKLGTSITRLLAKGFHSPTPKEEITVKMNYPYYYFWFGGKNNYKHKFKSFDPKCPFLFVYGLDKPIRSFDNNWAKKQARKKGNHVVGVNGTHWVMTSAQEEFNEIIVEWLAK